MNVLHYTDPTSLVTSTNIKGEYCCEFIVKSLGHIPEDIPKLDKDVYMAAFMDSIQRLYTIGHDVGHWSFAIATNVIR